MTTTATLDAERADLLDQLAEARAALIGAAEGLSDEQLGQTPTASALCLGGLLKHTASMEDKWMDFIEGGAAAMGFDLPDGVSWQDLFTGNATPPRWMTDHGAEFRMQPDDDGDAIRERYRAVAERTAQVVAAAPDLSAAQPLPAVPWHQPGETRSIRRVLIRLVQEISQHAGHAEIVRESIDGKTAG
ncbi:DinB family protein [Pseudonocardia endophytica]|uniref:Uncharacterized protein DUF664 n=1 Tax=Pseudonocardia endophytica TaxID=401976 RepID=A0A4R1HP25_PSEEN|nr:DinB family protein [Pseudonocardia endophytica]TCK22395.1 uncharacterized protein DUF664 [Pseudonocardia endophytica]